MSRPRLSGLLWQTPEVEARMRDDVERSAASRTPGTEPAESCPPWTSPAVRVSAGPDISAVRDVSTVPADLGAVDLLARAHLEARRQGVRLVLRGASDELRCLLRLAGLADVLEVESPEPSAPSGHTPAEPTD